MQAEESPPQLQTAAHALIHSLSRIETDSDISHISRLSALECEIRPEAFASQQIATACATLLSKASSTESLRWISSLICSATFRSTAARELFAVAELRDALCVSLLTVKNCDEVRFMCSAICSLTTQCTQGQRLFGDQTAIDCLCNAATHITTDADADASRWWCSAVCNITWMHRDNEERFGSSKPLLVSIAGVGSTITTTPAAYWWLSAIASVCRQSDVTRALVTRTAVVSEQMLCTIVNWAAMSSEGIRAAGDALSFLSACEVFRRRYSASTVLRTAWCTMASHPQYGSSPEVVESCCRALCNLVIGPMERKQHYGTFEVRDALSNLAPGATSANSAIFFCAAVAHYCSACATLSYCLTERIENSLVLISMSLSSTLRFDARLEVCKWWCSIVAELSQTPWWTTTHASTYLPPLIQVVHSCFQEHTIEQTYIERTEVIVRSWSKCVSTMVGILHDKCSMIDEVLLVRLRSAIASIAHHVTTDETIVTLCCMIHSVSSETVAGTVLADSTMRSAFVALATRARSPVAIRWLCSSISAITIVDDAFQEFWGFDEGYALMMHMGQCMIECYDDQHDGVEEALISWATLICNITANHSMNTKRLLTFSVCNRSEGSMSSPCPRSFPDLVCELGTMCSSTRSVLWISGVVCNLSQYPQDDLCRYVWVLNKSRVPLTVHAMGRAIIHEPDRTTTSYVDGVLWFAHALAHVTAQPEVQRVCCQMETCLNTIVAVTNALPLDERVVTALCGALCNLSNRLASNQIALACHPNMYSATIRLIGAIQEASSAVWWMRLILLLVPKARQPTPWFHDDLGRRCLIQLVEGNLVVGSVAIETFGMLLTFVVNSVARCAPDTMQNALLPCCEALLQRVARRLDANVDPAAHEWIHRAHKAVSNQPQHHPPPIGPADTESILNLPSPVVVISRGQRKVSFESNVEAYARFRRLTSR